MNNTSLTALGGIIAALSIVFMFTSIIPFMTCIVPAFAGLILIVTVKEVDIKWSVFIYITVSILSIFILADREAALMYVFFFGHYTFTREFFERKITNKFLKTILKFIWFNFCVVTAYVIVIYVLGIPIEEIGILGKYTAYVLLFLANITFYFYESIISSLSVIYDKVVHKKIIKIFKF
ncbi:MAG: hypothetical protein GX241_04725 [Ruminococcaceae bacterium]|nr:hypothetical protein [Oscillospiraceae bacterium]